MEVQAAIRAIWVCRDFNTVVPDPPVAHAHRNTDMSPIVFKKIANLNTGVIPIKWGFQPKGWAP